MLTPVRDCVDVMPRLRAALGERTLFYPLDFLRTRHPGLLRQSYLDDVLHGLGGDDDFSAFESVPSGTALPPWLCARRLRWDSDFFDYPVVRLETLRFLDERDDSLASDCTPFVRAFLDRLRTARVRYTFAVVDARNLPLIRGLQSNGFELIETRATYHRSLKDYAYPHRFETRLATAEDLPSLSRTAVEMVNPYDRFHADPFITREQADRLMATWVEASVLRGFADGVLVPNRPQPTAFCTFKLHRDHWERWGVALGQPVLSAVSPELKGWYLRLISEIGYHLRDQGAEHAFMSTQVTNRAVVRVWESLGYGFGGCEYVLRKVLE